MSELYASTLRYHMSPIIDLLDDPSVSEVMINGPKKIFIERRGRVSPCPDHGFSGDEELMAACINIDQFSGKRLGGDVARVDARLPDGSRVHIVTPPVSTEISLAIRKFQTSTLNVGMLLKYGSITIEAARLIKVATLMKQNILVSGGTGSGKTTLLNVIADFIPEYDRVLVLEDTRELQIKKPHVVRLETRPPNQYERGEVTMRDLLHSTLRMRPDRIIMGEIRGGEAMDLLNALNSGHGGTMTTLHANTPWQALAKLETLVLFAGEELPIKAIRGQIATSIQLVVQTNRFRDGSRKIEQIAEILPQLDGKGDYQVRTLYHYEHRGLDAEKRVLGRLMPTGELPSFFDDAVRRHYTLRKVDFGQGAPGDEELTDPGL